MSTAGDAPSASSTIPRPAPLSEVMLAMDIVDTLRHHRSIVEAELNEDAREQAFIDRVKAIYESQGIDVPDEVVAQGVRALEEDRFTYEPPERTFTVRLAEIYVTRGSWGPKVLVVGLLVAALLGWFWWSKRQKSQALVEGFAARVASVETDREATRRRLEELARELAQAGEGAEPTVLGDLRATASTLVEATRARLANTTPTDKIEELDPDAYPDAREDFDRRLEERRRIATSIRGDVGRIAGQLETIRHLRSLGAEVPRVMALLAGLQVSQEDAGRIRTLRDQAEAAIDAGDAATAKERVETLAGVVGRLRESADLRELAERGITTVRASVAGLRLKDGLDEEMADVERRIHAAAKSGASEEVRGLLRSLRRIGTVANQTYQLRIVSREGKRTGFWRHPWDRPNVRNHYINVEAIGRDGRPMALEFKSDEDQSLRRSTVIGVRVPEEVWNRIRQDKVDNGIVDDNVFGEKQRGRRLPDYRFEVAGGWIPGE